MGNKYIRDYVPGKNDFLSFAKTMNKNAEMDFKKQRDMRVQSAGEASTPTAPAIAEKTIVLNPAQEVPEALTGPAAYARIQSNFKRALDDSAKGIDTSYKNYFGGK